MSLESDINSEMAAIPPQILLAMLTIELLTWKIIRLSVGQRWFDDHILNFVSIVPPDGLEFLLYTQWWLSLGHLSGLSLWKLTNWPLENLKEIWD